MDLSKFRILKRLRNIEAKLDTLSTSGISAIEPIAQELGPQQPFVLVVAGNAKQFENWRRDERLTPREAKYVHSPEIFYGYDRKTEVYFLGTWSDRRDATELWDVASKRYDRITEL